MLTKYKLGELVDVTRGMSLPGENYSESGELIRLTLGNFNYNGGGFKENTSKSDIYYIGEVKSEYILNKGDIITPLTEQTLGLLGSTAMIPESGKYIQSQDVALVTPDESKLDHLFCYYLVSSDVVKKQLSAAAQQTKIRHTSPDKIKDCTVWIPELKLQEKIGKTLYGIDQKIALNTRMNAELEAMAKQLYDYWFVQFDFPFDFAQGKPNENGKPYKSSGGKMVWNEKLKREIPEGWEVKNLFHIAKFTNGIACQNYRPTNENKLPVIKIREMHDGFGNDTEYATTNIPESVKVYNKDVLFSWSASLEVMLWSLGEGALNQHIFKVTSNNGYPKSFFFYQLLEYVDIFKKIAEARKTTMGHITQDHLEQSAIIVPPDLKLPNLLEKKLSPIMDKIVKLNEEKSSLTRLRDSLLPMLMNGQVTIE